MGILIDWKIVNIYSDGLVYRTIGAEQYCGYEIELNLPLDPHQAAEIINTTVARCKDEQKQLTENESVRLYNRNVSFKKMLSLNDEEQFVWRMVLPDENGRLPEEPNCTPAFKKQIVLRKKTRS